MTERLVLGICGSLRRGSYNAALLRLVSRVGPGLTVAGGDLAGRLPLFNPDVEGDEHRWPDSVHAFRHLAARASGLVIATPEYAHGPAGVTKNAIDWLVGSGGLVGRPTLLMSASPGQAGGMRAHAPLMPTLTLLGAVLVDCVVVSRAGSRVDAQGEYEDPAVVERMRLAVAELEAALSYADRRSGGLSLPGSG
ncbi:NADPH-dependent FMN reductase [Nocardiopsis sp. MG754419]|uniref:NADPH-dependent FMN reductase n=1 Tax=Nocardiopsis sp. MG754419 TaxID=2259865 RepID=UPI001BA728D7|nr:NADPH-dependent FMN reductase [Nocardiopsis sp. MG754419]MBR8744081.1 NADPH-dependent FMN reductase [Nocardiopsis sp. MG754419]